MGFRMKFNKPPLSIEDQISLLQNRGLEITEIDKASYYLQNIGYYRLSAYYIPFRQPDTPAAEHKFSPGTSFQDILDLYIFDRQLRLILLDALERLEIALRAKLSQPLSISHGSHWYLESDLFYSKVQHAQIIAKIANDTGHHNGGKKVSEAVKHYYSKYSDPPLPPTWVIFEELSIGSVSRIFKSIKNEHKKELTDSFNVTADVLESWLHSLTVLRNKCAHHSRVWNNNFPAVKIPKKGPKIGITNAQKLQGLVSVISHMLTVISGDTTWKDRVTDHIKTCPVSYNNAMGFNSTNT